MDSAQSSPHQQVALFYHPAYLDHAFAPPAPNRFHSVIYDHPESPQRLRAILAALARHGIPETALLLPEPVDLALLREVHDPAYIDIVADISYVQQVNDISFDAETEGVHSRRLAIAREVVRRGGGLWDLDTYISPGSYNAAILAAGAATSAVDAVMSGKRSAFALVRPPGHHAQHASAMGFCLFNNVAVAAQRAVRKHNLQRVMIIDWDVHHGNGTQNYFYSRSDVLFFSSHRYPFYPGTGALHETGAGAGKGYTVNVPLPAGVGDAGHLQLFTEIVVPLAHRYKPELILISAGYDSHLADPLGGMAVTTAGFTELARIVRHLSDEIAECNGRVAAILEGGYNVEALSASVVATIGALGAPKGSPSTLTPTSASTRRAPDITSLLSQVKRIHSLQI